MDRYKQNPRWLKCFALVRDLPLSAAYLTPFFLERGLGLSEIFLLQSIFSLAVVLLEVPSGYFADRFGRAFSIRLSVPIAMIGLLAYAVSEHYWQLVACELLLAVATSLLSGVDTALLVDSLKADGKGEAEYTSHARQLDGLRFLSTGLAVPAAFALVHFYGVSSVIIADTVLIGLGSVFTWKLVEAPRLSSSQEAERIS
ncbi:MAG TPA: MFS transporter, partial [Candidatus Limnocylindrales bacterium]|nr:MFS transporter [Candidatus Limnocylindrales bacterium]